MSKIENPKFMQDIKRAIQGVLDVYDNQVWALDETDYKIYIGDMG